ncbi:hypothetical protein K9M59_02620 [Candidatus Gracilibacteria bacterium]|nr:hypothetical protein [Candidatus Gracilibacteria bacterium]MCF7819226.1 hypothetical protein [Candidatus Gracilibacteria bacterium]
MQTFLSRLFFLTGALLPLHGAMTVFLPSEVRYWKEIVLVIFVGVALAQEIIRFRKKEKVSFLWSEVLAFLFSIWLFFLVVTASDQTTALIAARYLGWGFLLFLSVARILNSYTTETRQIFFQFFLRGFLLGCGFSVLFGIWAKHLGGFEILQNFYSPTISSWVPGQILPLYHETGSFIRMQGMSSGPTEFAHLLLAGLFLLPFARLSQVWKVILSFLFLWGIGASFTRTAWILAFAWMLYFSVQYVRLNKKNILLIVGIFILGGVGIFSFHKDLRQNIFQRVGSSEHLTRPLQALRLGFKEPLTGSLGQIGPAARIHNLHTRDDDQALIAENVFVDYFAQTGIIGFLLAVGFFGALFVESDRRAWPFLIAVLIAFNVATLLDMTPIALSFFLIFDFFVKIRTMRLETS